MEMGDATIASPTKSATVNEPLSERNSEVFASAVVQSPSPKMSFGEMQPQAFEKAPTLDVNMAMADSDVQQSSIFQSAVPGGSSELANQASAYRKMIEKEQAEINLLKQ